MSCSIFAIPYALAWIVGSVVVSRVNELPIDNEPEVRTDQDAINLALSAENSDEIEIVPCSEAQIISEKHFIEKSLETPFVDKNLLIKTLKEHGVTGLSENDYGQIICYSGSYKLKFERNSEVKPYYLVISCLDTDNAEAKLTELGNEYMVNVQEESYNNLVAKLKENNMQIENEEICDDNTIVITVNLE